MSAIDKMLLEKARADASAFADVYRTVASEIRVLSDAKAKITDKATSNKEGLWGKFKESLVIGLEAGHDAHAIKIGLTVACMDAEIPRGTYASYVGTVANMLDEVVTGISPNEGPALDATTAQLLKIKDARERYQDRETKLAREARKALTDTIAKWSPEQIGELVEAATNMQADRELAAEVGEERQAANG